jgi:hypothetical protein
VLNQEIDDFVPSTKYYKAKEITEYDIGIACSTHGWVMKFIQEFSPGIWKEEMIFAMTLQSCSIGCVKIGTFLKHLFNVGLNFMDYDSVSCQWINFRLSKHNLI